MAEIFGPAREGFGELEDRGSRFLCWVFALSNEEDFLARLSALRTAHPKARHHCWAWRLGETYRFSDDGEPGGTAGRPMLQALDAAVLAQAAAICVRYFGGVKLGTGGLVRAYAGATAQAVERAGRARIVRIQSWPLRLPFARLGIRDEIKALFPDASVNGAFDEEGWAGTVQMDSAEATAYADFLAARGLG
jgi:uncharacterized YigZ family protein